MPVDGLTASRRCSPLPLLASRRRRPRWMPSGADTVHVTVFSHVLFVLVLMGAMCDGVGSFTIHVSSHHPIRNAKTAIPRRMSACHDSHSCSARSTVRRLSSAGLLHRGNLGLCRVSCPAIFKGRNSWDTWRLVEPIRVYFRVLLPKRFCVPFTSSSSARLPLAHLLCSVGQYVNCQTCVLKIYCKVCP